MYFIKYYFYLICYYNFIYKYYIVQNDRVLLVLIEKEKVNQENDLILCNKEKEDKIKLFRETNDGMNWIRKQFGIIGIQVAGNIFFYIII